MLMDVNFDFEVSQRLPVGRGRDRDGGGTGASSCLASCCCCSGCKADLPSDGFLDDRV